MAKKNRKTKRSGDEAKTAAAKASKKAKAPKKKTDARSPKKTGTKAPQDTIRRESGKTVRARRTARPPARSAMKLAPTAKEMRNHGEISESIDLALLHADEIEKLRAHCAAILSFRDFEAGAEKLDGDRYCYMASGEGKMVSIYDGPFKVGQMSRTDAEANGFRPCG